MEQPDLRRHGRKAAAPVRNVGPVEARLDGGGAPDGDGVGSAGAAGGGGLGGLLAVLSGGAKLASSSESEEPPHKRR